ncbi:MAG TPA: aminomethyl transferase family protein [Intrasporangiaceae bacterium]|nr:aminomethyl transferase family protein [Intrasporangiaceae bacterium]
MVATTPFHERLSELNDQHLYTHWQGHLSAVRYSHAPKHEYFAVRNSVGIFDTSPLYKYRITGPDAEAFLARLLVRNVTAVKPGRAAYTLWCDERGFVMEDGVLFRHTDEEFLLTSARPALAWLTRHRHRHKIDIEDVSDDFGMLAVQGPRSRTVLSELTDVVDRLGYFDLATTAIAGADLTVSRTGYTGDLGFELTVPRAACLDVLDAVLAAGEGHGLRPFGEDALNMLRIEAGLPLVDVEWTDSTLAWNDEQRVTPTELGMGWMLKGVLEGTRRFLGSDAIREELRTGSSRWATTGIVVDWQDWNRLHREAGLLPVKDEIPLAWESWLRDESGEQIGYATSVMYSPALQRHIGIARVRPTLADPGTTLQMETTILHSTQLVRVTTAPMPFFNPERKAAKP